MLFVTFFDINLINLSMIWPNLDFIFSLMFICSTTLSSWAPLPVTGNCHQQLALFVPYVLTFCTFLFVPYSKVCHSSLGETYQLHLSTVRRCCRISYQGTLHQHLRSVLGCQIHLQTIRPTHWTHGQQPDIWARAYGLKIPKDGAFGRAMAIA